MIPDAAVAQIKGFPDRTGDLARSLAGATFRLSINIDTRLGHRNPLQPGYLDQLSQCAAANDCPWCQAALRDPAAVDAQLHGDGAVRAQSGRRFISWKFPSSAAVWIGRSGLRSEVILPRVW